MKHGKNSALSHFLVAVGVFLLAFILFQGIGSVLALLIDGHPAARYTDLEFMQQVDFSTDALRIMNFFGSALSMLVTALVTPLIVRARPLVYLAADHFGRLKWVSLSVVFFLLTFPLMEALLVWNQQWDLSAISPTLDRWNIQMESTSNALYSRLFGQSTPVDLGINLVLMAIIPAIAEEFLFRGLILNSLHGLFRNIHVAIVVTAVLFSLLHLQPLKLVPMTTLAIALGYMVYWNGSVWPAVLAHAINNSLAVINMYTRQGDYEEVLSGEPAYPLWVSGVVLLVLIALFRYLGKHSTPKLHSYYE